MLMNSYTNMYITDMLGHFLTLSVNVKTENARYNVGYLL